MDPLQIYRDEVKNLSSKALSEIGVSEPTFDVEVPSTEIADFAVPCFPFAKSLKKSPMIIASEAAGKISASELISKVWAENGYLNFQINSGKLAEATLQEIFSAGSDYGKGEKKSGRLLLEHTSVNPTGPIHIGRARNPIIGDTLARCLRACGYDVLTEYYVNDVGKQVIILTWGLEHLDKNPEDDDIGKVDHRLVGYYRRANKMMEENSDVAAEIGRMLRKFEDGDKETIEKVRRTAKMMLDGILESLALINVSLDSFMWESTFIENGNAAEVVNKLKASEYCKEEDGASYLELESFGIHGRETRFFFTRGDGTTLYTTRDVTYHLNKFSRADRVVNILGEDQKLGQAQLAIALHLLGVERSPECVFYSFVSLPEGKMSTRRGQVVNLDDLIEEAESRALEEVKKRRSDLSEDKMNEIAKAIGRGAVRYNMLRVQPEKPLVFRWEDALNFEGNSAPFVQYAHARACSILKKAGGFDKNINFSELSDAYETKLIKTLAKFPSVIKEAGEKSRIHLIPLYAHELAASFNLFYTYVPVLKGDNKDARLALVDCTRTVLSNALYLMGLNAPEEM